MFEVCLDVADIWTRRYGGWGFLFVQCSCIRSLIVFQKLSCHDRSVSCAVEIFSLLLTNTTRMHELFLPIIAIGIKDIYLQMYGSCFGIILVSICHLPASQCCLTFTTFSSLTRTGWILLSDIYPNKVLRDVCMWVQNLLNRIGSKWIKKIKTTSLHELWFFYCFTQAVESILRNILMSSEFSH